MRGRRPGKNRRCIRWNTSRIFLGRARRRWSRIIRRSRTVNVGQAPRSARRGTHSSTSEPICRPHRRRSTAKQSQEHLVAHPPQSGHGHHGRIRIWEILSRVRHAVRRRPVALCGIALHLCPHVSRRAKRLFRGARTASASCSWADRNSSQPTVSRLTLAVNRAAFRSNHTNSQ